MQASKKPGTGASHDLNDLEIEADKQATLLDPKKQPLSGSFNSDQQLLPPMPLQSMKGNYMIPEEEKPKTCKTNIF